MRQLAMIDESNIHSLILDHVRALRGGQDLLINDVRDLKFRVGQDRAHAGSPQHAVRSDR
jgi:hypothetical protein